MIATIVATPIKASVELDGLGTGVSAGFTARFIAAPNPAFQISKSSLETTPSPEKSACEYTSIPWRHTPSAIEGNRHHRCNNLSLRLLAVDREDEMPYRLG